MSPYSSTTRSQSQSPRNSPQMRYRSMSSRPVLPTSNARPSTAAAPGGKQQPPNYTNFNFQGLTNRRYNNNNDSPGTPQRSRQTANLLASLDKSILQIRDWLVGFIRINDQEGRSGYDVGTSKECSSRA